MPPDDDESEYSSEPDDMTASVAQLRYTEWQDAAKARQLAARSSKRSPMKDRAPGVEITPLTIVQEGVGSTKERVEAESPLQPDQHEAETPQVPRELKVADDGPEFGKTLTAQGSADSPLKAVQRMTFVAEAPRHFGALPDDGSRLGATAMKQYQRDPDRERQDMLAHRHSSLDTAGSRTNSRSHRTNRDVTPRRDRDASSPSKEIPESNAIEDSHVAQHEGTHTPEPSNMIRMDAVAQESVI